METGIAILRGINVSGVRKLPMADLRKLCEGLGWVNVRTYIQSGNVVFEVPKVGPALARSLEQAIRKQFGFDVPVLVLTSKDLQQVIAGNPFIKENGIELDKLHVTFLAEVPKQRIGAEGNYAPDRFILGKKEIYLHCPEGYGNTKLNNTFFENKLKVSATTRNWRTVNELVRMAKGS